MIYQNKPNPISKRENGMIKITDLKWEIISKLLDVKVDQIYNKCNQFKRRITNIEREN
jgi:hypothetical protein